MRTLLFVLFALFSLSGCVSLEEKRALYLEENPDLTSYKAQALASTPARAVPGMTLEEVKLVLGPSLYRTASYSDGITVYRKGINLVLYFKRGQLSYWSNYR